MTKKGKGYKPAEINPSVYHGVGKFDKEVGVIQSSVSPKTYSKTFGRKNCYLWLLITKKYVL